MVSVIVPIFNGEKYIKNLLDDLSNQDYNDFETIFVNDGSDDRSYDLLCEVQNEERYFFDIIIINQDNRGVSAARNAGIERTRGQFICFVDVDDRIEKQYISSMASILESHKAQLVFCKIKSSNSENDETNPKIKSYTRIESLRRFLFGQLITGACSLMVRKDILINHQLRFAEGYKYSEDLHMVWRLIASSEVIIELNAPLYIYNVTVGSAMDRFGIERSHSLLLMKDLEKYFKREVPDFYPLFKKYGVAKMAWSLLWQAAYHLDYSEFKNYIHKYNFREELIKLFTYKKIKVKISSAVFCISPLIYYYFIRIASNSFRKI